MNVLLEKAIPLKGSDTISISLTAPKSAWAELQELQRTDPNPALKLCAVEAVSEVETAGETLSLADRLRALRNRIEADTREMAQMIAETETLEDFKRLTLEAESMESQQSAEPPELGMSYGETGGEGSCEGMRALTGGDNEENFACK